MVTATPKSRICSRCGRDLPLTDFRYRVKGKPGRQGCCRTCYNARMRTYRTLRRSKDIRGFAADIRREKSLSRISSLCSAMISRFGGVEGFCQLWQAHLAAAPAGSRIVLSSFSALLRLLEVAETAQQHGSLAELSDAELDAEIRRLAVAHAIKSDGLSIDASVGPC